MPVEERAPFSSLIYLADFVLSLFFFLVVQENETADRAAGKKESVSVFLYY
jgi:hypothetical protein